MTESHDNVHDEELQNANLRQNKADGQSPGELLREGRLAHDYSVEDLCAQTKLSPKTVQALEDNDFGSLSQPVFARGYYRQCAKVLDLDVERVMAAYTAWAGEPATQPAAPATSMHVIPHDVTPGGGFRLRGLLVFVLLIALVIIAAMVLLPSFSSDTASSDSNNDSATVFSDDSNDGSNSAGDNGMDDTSADRRDSLSTSIDTDSSELTGTPDVAGKQADQNPQARTGQAPGGRNVNQTLGITPPGQEDAGSDGQNADSEAAVEPNHLTLTFNKRSWVRVTDANGNRMASGIFEAGDTQEFDGTPPYKITLGFAPGVDVTIGGQKVDVASQTGSGSIAHLTVEAAANN